MGARWFKTLARKVSKNMIGKLLKGDEVGKLRESLIFNLYRRVPKILGVRRPKIGQEG